jgi:CSLREA domain-containing protein
MTIRIALALGATFALASAAEAANFVVNSTLDAVDAAPNNGVCATAGNLCTLRAAIQEANANASADTIQVPAGTYTLTIAGNDDFAAMGDLDLRTAITIQGAGASQTIIDANGIDRAFEAPFIAGGPALAIEDVTIRGGAVTDAPGAAVYHGNAGTLLLRGIVFSDNQVAGNMSSAIGGAVSINGGGTATIEDCVLTGNTADRGGAIFSNSPLYLQLSTIADNVARAGGALELYGTTIIQQSTISGNEATGGSIVDSDGDLTLRNSTVTGNIATSSVLAAFGSSSVVIERATVADNATDHGIRAFTASQIEVFGSVIAGVASGAACSASGGTVTSLGFNLDDDGSCATQPSDLTAADPKLGPLADNGGNTKTRAPRFGSPLLDGGDAFPSCGGTDQRGILRPFDGGGDPTALCDIGAVEVAPEPASLAAGIAALLALALRRSSTSSPHR